MSTPKDKALAIGGEVYVDGSAVYLKQSKRSIVYTESPGRNWRQEEDFATLYADAHNTYNSCQMLPSEMLEKLREAKERAQELSDLLSKRAYTEGSITDQYMKRLLSTFHNLPKP